MHFATNMNNRTLAETVELEKINASIQKFLIHRQQVGRLL